MSWDVDLVDENGSLVEVTRHTEGGTYKAGGTTTAELNVTYNYTGFYRQVLGEESLRELHNKKAINVIPMLVKAVKALSTKRDQLDYWKCTSGNAGYALGILLMWAKQYPDATFKVT